MAEITKGKRCFYLHFFGGIFEVSNGGNVGLKHTVLKSGLVTQPLIILCKLNGCPALVLPRQHCYSWEKPHLEKVSTCYRTKIQFHMRMLWRNNAFGYSWFPSTAAWVSCSPEKCLQNRRVSPAPPPHSFRCLPSGFEFPPFWQTLKASLICASGWLGNPTKLSVGRMAPLFGFQEIPCK